jgi:hypothetical protein
VARKTPEQNRQELEGAAEAWHQIKGTIFMPFWRWFRGLSGLMQAGVVLIALVVGFVMFSGTSGGSKSSPEKAASASAEKAASASAESETSDPAENEASGSISFVSGNCGQDFVVGNLDFVVVLRNDGTSPVDVAITPVRHYQDGSTNRSPMDTMYDTVPPDGQPHQLWHSYDVQSDHVLIACEAEIDDGNGTNVVDLPVNT